jgi:integrase
MVVAIAYTGARWSEIVGLTPECVDGDTVNIDWKLYELNGRFYRGRPKDGSIRPANLPPFLAQLFSAHLRASAGGLQCTCRNTEEPWCPGAEYVFLAPAEDTSAGPTTARGSSGQPLTAGTCRGRGKARGRRFRFS